MLEASGVVVALEGEYALVQVDQSGCGRCHEAGGCGGNPLNKLFGNTSRRFRVMNPGNSAIGDCVTVVISEGSIRHGAVRAYVLPLVGLFSGAFLGLALAGELGAMFGALVGLLLAGLILRHALAEPRELPSIRQSSSARKLLHISEGSVPRAGKRF